MSNEEEEEYTVERIVGHRTKMGKSEYLVHWEGFSSDEDTWEPIENLHNCFCLIRQFEILNSAEKTKSKIKSVQSQIDYHKSINQNNLASSIYKANYQPDKKSQTKTESKSSSKSKKSTKKKKESNTTSNLVNAILIPKIKINIPTEKPKAQDDK